MEHVASTANTRLFRLAGSNPPSKHRRRIARELLRRGSRFEYVSFGHTRSTDEDYALLRRSGCLSLFFGVESGSQRILDEALNKKTTVKSIRWNLAEAKREGILISAGLIIPSPFENRESLAETVEMLAELQPDGFTAHPPVLVPGTAWHRESERFGFRLELHPLPW